MTTIHIVTDSTCDIPQHEITANGIHVVPLAINIDDQMYTDGVDITPLEFYEKMQSSKQLPKSSQPAPGVFQSLYDELGKDGDVIISIHMTGGMSGTVDSARAGAELSTSNVTVIDSRYIAWALAFQVREAVKLRDQGASVEEIVQRLNHVRENTRLFVVLDTLENMVKGGRIGRGKAMFGSLLNLKPVGNLDTGDFNPCAKPRSHKQVVKYLFEQFEADTQGKTVHAVGLSHALGLEAMGQPLIDKVATTGFDVTDIAYTSPIIATHTGLGAIGFMYYAD